MPRTGKKKRVLKMPQNSHFISRGTETEYGLNMKVEGISLQIEGGDYELSHRAAVKEKTSDCSLNGLAECHSETPGMEKERRHMKIAVTYENGQVFQHFGHTEQFKVYDVED